MSLTVGPTYRSNGRNEVKTAKFYPDGTSPQQVRHCGHPTDSDYDRKWNSATCLLLPDHDGCHDYSANWNAHVEVESQKIGDSAFVDVAFRSWHDTRSLVVRSRKEADELLTFLVSQFDDAYGSSLLVDNDAVEVMS